MPIKGAADRTEDWIQSALIIIIIRVRNNDLALLLPRTDHRAGRVVSGPKHVLTPGVGRDSCTPRRHRPYARQVDTRSAGERVLPTSTAGT